MLFIFVFAVLFMLQVRIVCSYISDLCVYGLETGLCGFAAKTPDVVELLSMDTSKSVAPLYFKMSISAH